MTTPLLGLDGLLTWLEYGRTSGYPAARQSREQEEHWADLLRGALPAATNPTAVRLQAALDQTWAFLRPHYDALSRIHKHGPDPQDVPLIKKCVLLVLAELDARKATP